jgi:hypothetical protein
MQRIPVFVSCPTTLNPEQEKQRKVIIDIIEELQMEARALGRSDYPKDYPLKEVFIIAKHCAGGIILGFEQLFVTAGVRKRGAAKPVVIDKKSPAKIPTPWNHLEAGILFGLKLPIIVFKEDGIEGGVFDYGISDAFVHTLPVGTPDEEKISEIKNVLLKWYGAVSTKYAEY